MKWKEPCEAMFIELATTAPNELVKLIDSNELKPTDMTFAVEHLGKVQNSQLVVPVLLRALAHSSSLVREGAIYGISSHINVPEVRQKLKEIAENDVSPGVKLAAEEALSF